MLQRITYALTSAALVSVTIALGSVRAQTPIREQPLAGPQDAMQDAREAYETARTRQAIATDKASVVAELMGRWGAEIGDSEKGRVGIERALGAADPEKLLKITQAKTWEDVVAISLGLGPGLNALGDKDKDLVFTPLPPCRVFDSRFGTGAWAGPYGDGNEVSFFVTDPLTADGHAQGGKTNCGFPFSVGTGVALNITVVPLVGSGNLRIFPFGTAAPNASILNFYAGTNLANAADVQIALTNIHGDVTLRVDFATQVHFVVDIIGYFARPFASALDATDGPQNSQAVAAGANFDVGAVCPSGYTAVGGAYYSQPQTALGIWYAGSFNGLGYRAAGTNFSTSNLTVSVVARCARTPGR